MLDLAVALRARGHEVALACPEAPAHEAIGIASRAREQGLSPALVLDRGRGISLRRDRQDVARLRDWTEVHRSEIVHVWHSRDHGLLLRAGRQARRRRALHLIRSYKSAVPISDRPWNRWLFGPGSDGLVCVSPETAQRNRVYRRGRPVMGALAGVDLERFRPAEPPPALRASLGLAERDRVVAIVARAQRHRRFDLLLEAAARWFADDARARLLVIGRGTHIEETAVAPAKRLGIADRVVFAGYRDSDFVDVLRCAQLFTFLVPGSDGSCRALLEAQALGLPAVTSHRGVLPEIVRDGETGTLVEEAPAALARAWTHWFADETRRNVASRAARVRAEANFGRERFAERVEAFYREVASR